MMFATLHCKIGYLMIATSALIIAVTLVRDRAWKGNSAITVAAMTMALRLSYTACSDRHNVYVKGTRSYGSSMPTLSLWSHAIGLSPLLRWIVAPPEPRAGIAPGKAVSRSFTQEQHS